jgi:uncharacterized protein GlcG (DUF336 family)
MKLELARQLIAEARASAERRALKPLSIVVLDAGGQVRAFEREDGASNARFEIAFGKAHGALALGIGSRALMGSSRTAAVLHQRRSGRHRRSIGTRPGRRARKVERR